ncbi:3-deoxy-manno-octulosonate cytidylyltransferase [Lysinibacillus sp. NPDC093688]|uniref:3-deoxy-manno-octulosonate cytidylyltransferase n=1 Tax=Lysinibacillus sp. NPDC093688 TaxID=3390577 RepID=UPI003CFC3C7C
MKILGIIPARYGSSRFPGKPLADILGKPMIWWVYQQAIKTKRLDRVIVATDHTSIEEICKKFDIPVIMTSNEHVTPTDRLQEVSEKVEADLYICINGDEPLVDSKVIEKVIPEKVEKNFYVANLITNIKNSAEVIDNTNLKVVTDSNGFGVYISRSPIPYPKGSIDYNYKKHVGILAFTKPSLDFYVNTKRGCLETIEDIDLLRFIENHKVVHFIEAECESLSVDTPKDLEKVKETISNIYASQILS